MSESKKPITRTRQEVKNIDIDETKYVKKEDQYAYGINTFTTENDYLSSLEIKSKDNKTNTNVKLLSIDDVALIPGSYNSSYPTIDKAFMNLGYYRLIIDSFNGSDCIITRYDSKTSDSYIRFKYNFIQPIFEQFGITGKFNSEYMYFPEIKRTYSSSGNYTFIYILSDSNYDTYIKSYQHTLNISKGNEFEGLIIKFTEKPTPLSPTSITTSQLFIDNIKYIKDVIGFILKNGVVTPYVFTYKDDTLYLNGSEIDVNSLTITDDVVTL